MTARVLCNVAYSMLLEGHSHEEVEEMLAAPDPAEAKAERRAHLRALGVEVA